MREKREIRRAEKAEKLANMTEEQRAELEHSKKMHKKAKKGGSDGKTKAQRKAEKQAAMLEEQRRNLGEWLERNGYSGRRI